MTLSAMQILFLVMGAIATVVFVSGYAKGTKIALASYNDDTIEVDDTGDIQTYWGPIVTAVLTAVAVVALAGVHPAFIYVGPACAVGTAFGIGLAFFVDREPKDSK
jgi:hypothetical protein